MTMSQPAESQIKAFVAKYSAEIASQLQQARGRLRELFLRGYELVYDNYNALVFGFSPSERSSEAILSIAGYPRWITLFFLHGASMEDPDRLLQGQGTQVRGIRLASPDELDRSAVLSLIKQAIDPHRSAFEAAPPLRTVVKSVSQKQRPRRPLEKAAVAAAKPRRTKSHP